MTSVAIHQPNYLPYIGFFQKMALSDIFVILDNVQFSKDSYSQRTKIRVPYGSIWLTIPIEKKYNFKLINEVQLSSNNIWIKKHKLSIVSNYSKSPFFDKAFIERYYQNSFKNLQEFNEFGILYIKKRIGINTKIVRASELDINENSKSTDLLVDIVKKVGGDIYISGLGGRKYMAEEKFLENNIKLEYFEFKPFEYLQRWNGFEPYMSAIDLLFNLGNETGSVLS